MVWKSLQRVRLPCAVIRSPTFFYSPTDEACRSAQIIPGGFLTQPEASSSPLLDVQVTPRHSIYVASETAIEVIVDAALSYYHGSPYTYAGASGSSAAAANASSDSLHFSIAVGGSTVLSGSVGVNTTDNVFSFHVSQTLAPSTAAYALTLTGYTTTTNTTTNTNTTTSGGGGGGNNYTASSDLFYLPDKTRGSVVKIDRLYCSLLYRSNNTGNVFQPYFPYGYYGSYSGYFNVTGNPTAYADLGFNALNPVVDFTDTNLTYTLDEMDGTSNLMFQYDMRNSYQNLTSVAAQIPLVQDHPSLLTYYTADEPDGWGYPVASTTDAYDLLARADRYHPTALVLNCQNYYFAQYTAGTDIIMEDAYPVGINTTYSTKWATPVNRTYGDCGCDNCVGGPADLRNVPARVDDFHRYAAWLGGGVVGRKPVWAVPQAFSGEGYWSRDPTAAETWAMDLLAFNHGAKGRLAWIYPPSAVLGNATAQLAQVVTVAPVRDYLTGANPVLLQDGRTAVGNGSSASLDVAYWSSPQVEGVLVGVVNPVNVTVSATSAVTISLPQGLNVSDISSQPWGDVSWTLDGSNLIATGGLEGLATSYIILA